VTAGFTPDSPALLRALVTGSHYDTAVLVQRDGARRPVAAWALGTVLVTGDGIAGGAGLPTEALTFAFASVREATSAGDTAWDLAASAAGGPALPAGLALAPLPAGPAAPAVTLDLVPGSSSLPPVTIPVDGFAFGAHAAGPGGPVGGETGPASIDLEVTAAFAPASPALLRALVSRKHYASAVLTQRDAAGHPVAAWVLDDVFLSGDAIDGGSAAGPTERLTLAFKQVTEATGAGLASWDQAEHSADGPALPPGLVLDPLPAPPAPSITLDLSGGSGPAVSLPLNGYALGYHNTVSFGPRRGDAEVGHPSFDPLDVAAPFGAGSPALLRALVTGSRYDTAVLTQRDAGGRPVAAWALGDVSVNDAAVGGGNGLPAEGVRFGFGHVTEATSARTTSWNQATNSAAGSTLPPGLVLAPLSDSPPTDVTLSNATVAENRPAGTAVGTFGTTDPDAGDIHTYALVAGAGDTGNGAFALDAVGHLATAASFDFEARSGYSIRVRSTDAAGLAVEKVFTVGVTNVNEAPTAIALSASRVAENMPVGTTVGAFSTADPDAGDAHTYALVAGAGGADNGSFTIGAGGTLKAAAGFDFEARSSYSVRVRGTDAGGLSAEKVFAITITNVNEAPTVTAPGAQVAFEDVDQTISGIRVGDPDGGILSVTLGVGHGTLTLAGGTGLTVSGNGSAAVSLSGSIADLNAALAGLVYRGSLNYGGADALSITVSDGVLSANGSVAVTVKSWARQAEDVSAGVEALVAAAVLNQGQGNALKLNLKGNNGDAGKVQAFLNKVDALLQAGILSQAQANALLVPGNILLLSVTRR
jgi:type VI protein secretion system component Hcp